MHSRLVRTPGIYLVGFMGSGKTTIGSLLADELGWNFVDLDDDIETQAGSPITEIFDVRGEQEFRRLEHEALARRVRHVQTGNPMILSLGGGAYAEPVNYELVQDNGISIWLDCSLQLLFRRVAGHTHRPLARDPVRFEHLYHTRQSAYARADYRIEITGDDPAVAVAEIFRLPLF